MVARYELNEGLLFESMPVVWVLAECVEQTGTSSETGEGASTIYMGVAIPVVGWLSRRDLVYCGQSGGAT